MPASEQAQRFLAIILGSTVLTFSGFALAQEQVPDVPDDDALAPEAPLDAPPEAPLDATGVEPAPAKLRLPQRIGHAAAKLP